MKIYITQFGAWWSSTPEQWRAVVAAALTENGYNLDVQARRLKRLPYHAISIICDSDGSRRYRVHPGYVLFAPLDWEHGDFIDSLNEIG